MTMIRRGLLALFAATLLSAPAGAHVGHGPHVQAALAESDGALALVLANNSESVAEFYALSAPGGRALVIERQTKGAWRAVPIVTLEPGKARRLGAPEYRLVLDEETRAFLSGGRGALTARVRPFGRVQIRLDPALAAELAPAE